MRRVVIVLAVGDSNDVATHLGQLGADVASGSLFDDAGLLLEDTDVVRILFLDVGERPDLAGSALRQARKELRLSEAPVLVGVSARQMGSLDPSAGYDDFVALPCAPAELYARVRQLEWRRSEFSSEERTKIGHIVIDRVSHEVTIEGRRIIFTAREFSLLTFFASHRGRVFSRESLLARVWGARYDGGARTVDIHVRRLRAKLGDTFPLETLRGAGYVLRTPAPMTEMPQKKGSSR